MTRSNSIDVDTLKAMMGLAAAPRVLDVRREQAFGQASTLIAGAAWCPPDQVLARRESLARSLVVYCVHGHEVSQSVAAELRAAGFEARYLEGGIEAYEQAGGVTFRKDALPEHDWMKPTRWVTRERPKIDRIACPWLVQRFVDPAAQFFFVAPDRVTNAAALLGAVPFDIPDVPFSHHGGGCSFDAFISRFGISHDALDAIAEIVRGADTGDFIYSPQAAGLAAVSFGLSALHACDKRAVEAGEAVYDALYAWAREARDETHAWQGAAA